LWEEGVVFFRPQEPEALVKKNLSSQEDVRKHLGVELIIIIT
jgi:hypothetical protein